RPSLSVSLRRSSCPPSPTPFPYTTLFRSTDAGGGDALEVGYHHQHLAAHCGLPGARRNAVVVGARPRAALSADGPLSRTVPAIPGSTGTEHPGLPRQRRCASS